MITQQLTLKQKQFLLHLINLIEKENFDVSDIVSVDNETIARILRSFVDDGFFPDSYYTEYGWITNKNMILIIERYKEKFCKK